MRYVVCFYWQGDRWNETSLNLSGSYGKHLKRVGTVSTSLAERYVNNLYRGVLRFANRSFQFICFTNENLKLEKGIETRPFEKITERGVLPRAYMFSKEAGLFGHQVLCLDLDIVIVGSIRKFLDYQGEFCARSKFRAGHEHKLDGDVMSFRAGPETEAKFWTPLTTDLEKIEQLTKGRERYWMRLAIGGNLGDRWDKVAPGQLVSYKRHVEHKREIPPGVRIISCHGHPRPHQIENQWIKKYWT